MAVAVAAVVTVVAAYIGYGAAGRSVYADARAAQARGDCPAAVLRGFDLVTGPFELTVSRDVLSAAALRAECTVYLEARQAQEQQRYADAVAGYRNFRTAHPRSGPAATANADRGRALLECGLGHFRAGRTGDAVEPLSELAQTYPDDPGTPQARSAVIAARVAEKTGLTGPLPAPLGDDSPGSIYWSCYYVASPSAGSAVCGPSAADATERGPGLTRRGRRRPGGAACRTAAAPPGDCG